MCLDLGSKNTGRLEAEKQQHFIQRYLQIFFGWKNDRPLPISQSFLNGWVYLIIIHQPNFQGIFEARFP